ncbi:hypothetical protein HZS_5960, partial [Henneguya salminicola]
MLQVFAAGYFFIITSGLFVLLLIFIISTNFWIDYKKNKKILQKDIYKRYQVELPRLKKDFTLEELKEFNGLNECKDYRILTAIDGLVFDVTKRWDLYGPERPYCKLAGKDASRCLVNFHADLVSDNYDNLLDLSVKDIENLEEWKRQFNESYTLVGRLLKPGEEYRMFNYSEEDEIP